MVRRTLYDRHRLHALALARTLFAGADAGVQPLRRIGIRSAGSSLRPLRTGQAQLELTPRTPMDRPPKIYEFAFNALLFFWLMTLLPLEFQQPDGRLSLAWTMVYALVATFAYGFFSDVIVGRWYPELNEGAQIPRPRESVRRPLGLFLYAFVGFYFFSALAFLSRGVVDKPFAAGRMSMAALMAAAVLTAIFYGVRRLLCRRSGGRGA